MLFCDCRKNKRAVIQLKCSVLRITPLYKRQPSCAEVRAVSKMIKMFGQQRAERQLHAVRLPAAY